MGILNDLGGQKFVKSTFSQYVWNRCVEVSIGKDLVVVRDSKNQAGPVLNFNHDEWRAFVQGVKNDEFDLPS
ncbi:MAG: DUF397 domain-containing protein [Candidatus Paceibacterota bacterium]